MFYGWGWGEVCNVSWRLGINIISTGNRNKYHFLSFGSLIRTRGPSRFCSVSVLVSVEKRGQFEMFPSFLFHLL